jgi:hypothetical protein
LRLIEESNTLIRSARDDLARGAARGIPEAPACPEPRAAAPMGLGAQG